jgi:sortase A
MDRPSIAALRKHLPTVLIATGAALLGYVAIQYGSMYATQRKLAREWHEQQHATMPSQAEYDPSDSLLRITSPKIHLDAIVLEGSGYSALQLGPGHMEHTALPGEHGNVVISGHRDTFFRNVHKLVAGDMLTVQRHRNRYTYEVVEKKVVDSDDLSVIQPTTDDRLTLITCYPTYYVGPAPQRLIVIARLVSSSSAPSQSATNDSAATLGRASAVQ